MRIETKYMLAQSDFDRHRQTEQTLPRPLANRFPDQTDRKVGIAGTEQNEGGYWPDRTPKCLHPLLVVLWFLVNRRCILNCF